MLLFSFLFQERKNVLFLSLRIKNVLYAASDRLRVCVNSNIWLTRTATIYSGRGTNEKKELTALAQPQPRKSRERTSLFINKQKRKTWNKQIFFVAVFSQNGYLFSAQIVSIWWASAISVSIKENDVSKWTLKQHLSSLCTRLTCRVTAYSFSD